jgi:hypothetical protein
MSTAGPNYAGTAADDSGIGSVAWSNPSNAQGTADGSFATASLNNNSSHYLKCTGFGFAIPVGATIDNIMVEWHVSRSGLITHTVEDKSCKLVVGGVITGTDKKDSITDWGQALNYRSYSFTPAQWGVTVSASDINDAGFGAAIAADQTSGVPVATANVDDVRITIAYTGGGSVRRVGDGAAILREVQQAETQAAKRRVYFDIRQTDGLTAAAAETSGQPLISVGGGNWTTTGIGTLVAIVPSSKGRYYADLTAAIVSGASVGDVIESSYKSGNTVESPGDTVVVTPRLFIEGNVTEATQGRVRVYPVPSRNDNDYRGQVMLATAGVSAGLSRKVSRYIGGTADFYFEGAETDEPWSTALQSGTPVLIFGRSL